MIRSVVFEGADSLALSVWGFLYKQGFAPERSDVRLSFKFEKINEAQAFAALLRNEILRVVDRGSYDGEREIWKTEGRFRLVANIAPLSIEIFCDERRSKGKYTETLTGIEPERKFD